MISNIPLTKDNVLKIVVRFGLLIVGSLLDGFGIALQIKANLGPDPLSLFFDGLHQFFPITVGQAQMFVVFTFLALAGIINFRQLGIGTVIAPIMIRIGIDKGLTMMTFEPSTIGSFLLLISGILCLAAGVSLVINANLGKGAYDAFVLSLVDKLNKKYYQIRWPIDFTFLIVGTLLGGKFSITTIIIAFTIGKIIFFMTNKVKNTIDGRLDIVPLNIQESDSL